MAGDTIGARDSLFWFLGFEVEKEHTLELLSDMTLITVRD